MLVLRKRAATWILLGIWTFLGIFFAYVIPYALDPGNSTGGLADLEYGVGVATAPDGMKYFAPISAGCNVTLDMRYRDIKRVQPRENDWVNEIWLCDRGRYGHHFVDSPKRLTKPVPLFCHPEPKRCS